MNRESVTETRTQYGIKVPNGEIIWSTQATSHYLGVSIEDAATGKQIEMGGRRSEASRFMHNAIVKKAKETKIDIIEFLDSHHYVSRDILTITMDYDELPRTVQVHTVNNVPF